MLKNYWLVAVRKLMRHKAHSVINVLGLTIGVASCLIIFLLVRFELSYDHFHPGGDRIYRIVATIGNGKDQGNKLGCNPYPLYMPLRQEVTGCEAITGFYNFPCQVFIPGKKPRHFDAIEHSTPSPIIIADPQYFQLFQYKWLAGSPAHSLDEPFRVVLSAKEVENYFGKIRPDQAIGRQVVYCDSLSTYVSGVVQDWDQHTDFGFKDFISAVTVRNSFLKRYTHFEQWGGWTDVSQGFVKLSPGTTPAQVERQFPAIAKKYILLPPDFTVRLGLQPLADIHFNEAYTDAYSRKAHLPTLKGLMAIAVFILLLAAINFVNLSTAQSLQRAKEIGIRKVLGSRRRDIVWQFLGETFLLTFLTVLLSLLITPLLIRLFQRWLPPDFTLQLSVPTLLFLLGITVVTALLAGAYPAKVISALLPVLSLKGQSIQGLRPNSYLHRGLIVFQFTISLVFIIGTVIVARQLHYVLNTDLGFDKDAIITLHTRGNYPAGDREVLAQHIRELPGVAVVSRHDETPEAIGHGGTPLEYKGARDYQLDANYETCDTNYLRLFGIKLIAGRNIFPNDSIHEFLVNETAVRQLGFAHPADALGKKIIADMNDYKGPIVGVVRDFHSESLHQPIKPFFFLDDRRQEPTLSIKLGSESRTPEAVATLLTRLQELEHATFPNEKFEYSFFDDSIATLYQKEQQISGLMRLAMFIAIAISCMGLLGLATFAAERRSKEISIRKVLGAGFGRIIGLLTINFLWPVALAIVIATPIAWYFMHAWLQDFVYRTTIPWWIFGICGLSAIAIALLTVGYQAICVAVANPVEKLRSE